MSWPPANGLLVGLEFKSGWTRAPGLQAALPFGAATGPANPDQHINAGSWDSFAAGAHVLSLFGQQLRLFGWDSHDFGFHLLRNNARLLRVRDWTDSTFGRAAVRSDRQGVHPGGIRAPDVPEPFVSLRTRQIHAGNIPPLDLWGRPKIEGREKRVKPDGLDAQTFGAHWLSVQRRRVEAHGLNATIWGRAWVSHGAREIQPKEWDAQALGRPRVSPSQVVRVDGFEATGWGERITPAPQHVLPACIAPHDVPWANVFNHVQRIFHAGFQSNVQEHLRYGRAVFYNQTQFVHVLDDGEGGLAGEFAAVWTQVLNRDRQVHAYGPDGARFGDALLMLNARLLQPPGLDATQWGRAFVAHDRQPALLEGWDSMSLSRWHSVINSAIALTPAGVDASVFGWNELAERAQTIKWPGHFESLAFGSHWLSDAARSLAMGGMGAEPPAVPEPALQLHTQYLHPFGHEHQAFGGSWWQERFNVISPRWSHFADRMGEPALRKLTPELMMEGHEQAQWGDAFVRHRFRPLQVRGDDMARFGGIRIGESQQKLMAKGFHALRTSERTLVFNVYQPPPDPTQFIRPMGIYTPGEIAIPKPTLNKRAVLPSGWDSLRAGSPSVDDNAILPQSMEDTQAFGAPFLGNSKRYLFVEAFPDDEVFDPSRVVMKPLTIWVGRDTPAQAVRNHPPTGDRRAPSEGAVFGNARIANRTPPPVLVRGQDQQAFGGGASIANMRQYVEPVGLRSRAPGWPRVAGGDLCLEQYDAHDSLQFPSPILRVTNSVQRVLPMAWQDGNWGGASLGTFHRSLAVRGLDALRMGESGGGPRYMRQRLWVGEPDWPPFEGEDMSAVGDVWISHAVRELKAQGWDALRMDYEAGGWRLRMQVRRGAASKPPPAAQSIEALGLGGVLVGMPDLRPRLQAIYPDGATDMFRKGGNWWPR